MKLPSINIKLPALLAKQSKTKRVYILSALAIALVVALFVYQVVLPNSFISDYTKRTDIAKKELRIKLKELGDTTYLKVFNSTDSTGSEDLADLALITDKLKAAQSQLENYKQAQNSLKTLPLSGYFSNYHQIKANQKSDLAKAQKISEIMAEYNSNVQYMKSMSNLFKEVEANPISENETDLVKLSASVRAYAASLSKVADSVKKLEAPAKFKTFNDEFYTMLSGMSGACTELASAIDSKNMDLILSTASKVTEFEQTSNKLSTQVINLIGIDAQWSKSIRDLADTL